jgi:hypothetical protein
MRIASTARSMAPRPPNAPADPHPLWPRLIAMLGANIVTVYFTPRLPLDWKFATRTFIRRSHCLGYRQGALFAIDHTPIGPGWVSLDDVLWTVVDPVSQ